MKKTKNAAALRPASRFGDARDTAESPAEAGCTSGNSYSTMPRRKD